MAGGGSVDIGNIIKQTKKEFIANNAKHELVKTGEFAAQFNQLKDDLESGLNTAIENLDDVKNLKEQIPFFEKDCNADDTTNALKTLQNNLLEKILSGLKDEIRRINDQVYRADQSNELNRLKKIANTIDLKIIEVQRNYFNQPYFDEQGELKWEKWRDNQIEKLTSNNITQPNYDFITRERNQFTKLNTIYEKIKGLLAMLNNFIELKQKILFKTIANIQLYQKKNNVDVRKNLYEFERENFYNNIYNFLRIIYYSIFIIYIFFGNFIKLKLYKNYLFYIVAIIYLVLPFTFHFIFAGLVYLYESIMKLFGYNKNIRTYSDIVRANNIDNIYTHPIPNALDQQSVIDAYNTFINDPNNRNNQRILKFI